MRARARPAWVALGAARALNLPFVTTYHGSYAGRSSVKVLYNSVMARGDAVIANSHYTAGLIRSALSAGRSPDPGDPPRHGFHRFHARPPSRPSGSRLCARLGASRRMSASCCSPPA